MLFSPHIVSENLRPVGRGASKPFLGNVPAVVKGSNDKFPYLVSNEVVSLHLACYLGVNVPLGIIVVNRDSDSPHFASPQICPDQCGCETPLPPANAKAVAVLHPQASWRIIQYDILIMNSDRSLHNLAYDENSRSVYCFDHGESLFGRKGRGRPEHLKGWVGIGDKHCLANEISVLKGYQDEIKLIRDIPNDFIHRTVLRGLDIGYSRDDCEYLTNFLNDRKRRIHQLVSNQLGKFKKLSDQQKAELKCYSF